MFKKFVSIALVGLMLFSFAAVALAQGEGGGTSAKDEALAQQTMEASPNVSADKEEVKQLVEKLKGVAGEYKDYRKTLAPDKKKEIKDGLKGEMQTLKGLRQEGKTLKEGLKQKRDEIKSPWPEAKKDKELKNDVKAIKIELKNLHDATTKLRLAKLNLWIEFFEELQKGNISGAKQNPFRQGSL